MPSYTFTYARNEDAHNITVFDAEGGLHVCDDSHPNYAEIYRLVFADEEGDWECLFDAAAFAAKKFEALSDRVSIKGGNVFLDGDPVDNALTQQIVRFVNEGVDDWEPLVLFFENILANPNEHSREQLYGWLNTYKFAITDEGYIVGYKGVKGGRLSTNAGEAIVDGEVVKGYIPYVDGSVVEMPRSTVNHDPSNGCSTGLHVGTYSFAQSYTRGGCMLEVHVNPRDVVSVPTECSQQKMRVCRLLVVGEVAGQYATSVVDTSVDEDYEDDGDDFSNDEETCECGLTLAACDARPDCPGDEDEDDYTTDYPDVDEDDSADISIPDGFENVANDELDALRVLAKARKRGFERFAAQQGWINLAESGNGAWVRPIAQ